MAVTPASVNFGAVVTNTVSSFSLTVQNVGAGTLAGTASVPSPFGILSGGTYSLNATQSQTVTIGYNPTAVGANTQSVTFSGGAGATVIVTGTGVSGASASSGASWYVDPAATGANNGTSWANAWTSFSSVVWGSKGVSAGSTLYLSGGSVSQTYTASGDSMFTVGASGTSASNIVIRVGQDAGHTGKVIFNANGTYSPGQL